MNTKEEEEFTSDDPWPKDHDQEWIDECIAIISKKFSLERDSYEEMDSFLMYNSLKGVMGGPKVHDSYTSSDKDLQVSLVDFTPYKGPTSTYFFGMLKLRKEYPLTYIFRETIRERIANWFVKADVDFKEYKQFSKKFHLTTKDKEKLAMLFINKPLDELVEFPEMEVEINGSRCLFRASGLHFCEEEAEKFSNLATVLKKILD